MHFGHAAVAIKGTLRRIQGCLRFFDLFNVGTLFWAKFRARLGFGLFWRHFSAADRRFNLRLLLR
ncbi:Uncharacterised protein [Vibrio cholerae]|uniref:Uncharacterized protein n=1 Tax=Vibrio cholerae TaxID=666 RepID=A0A655Q1L3_VIBCL|nr:Uncharacterised protein [Vibrio cholerae]CSB22651.1 Uncharacterised protein [Vibrio cholerae]CSC55208.1 Uncharacterised protein [Vibrio cholerae]CSC88081.1 Uncharacterised protein [Vibrio cholerae]